MFEGYQNLPLPPPYRRVYFDNDNGSDDSNIHYINDVTKDITSVHPLVRIVAELKAKAALISFQYAENDENNDTNETNENSEEEKKNIDIEIINQNDRTTRTAAIQLICCWI